ncbi:MAG: aldo/keto reductase [Actinobacteria bacterium]|jgi:diketogulonate reductase-like aldo/keto reductase|nr:aldo/keto reductase [Actinomycetota bacterium]
MVTVPSVKLNNGIEMPSLGFGVFQIAPEEVMGPVGVALEAGYRLIDTAWGYRNEEGVGRAVRESGVPREQLFITTKLTNAEHGYDRALRAFDASLTKLGMDYVDLYLIHWPVPMADLYVETWRAFEKLYADGRARSIGVSNFTVAHLQRLIDETGTVPAVNQVELHPRLAQPALREFGALHGVATEAWAPIGQGKGLLGDPSIKEMATRYGKSPAQVVLRWHLQIGTIAIPKSVTPARIRENLNVLDFELSPADVLRLSELGPEQRIGPDPGTFDGR